MDEKIGVLLKVIRKQHKITLQELSLKSGLSVSYLSLLERGLNSPTIENLNKICQCLGITLTDLLLNLDSKKLLIKKNERKIIFDDKHGVRYEALTEGNRHMKGTEMVVSDTVLHISESHIADEIGYMIQGVLEMTLKGVVYTLYPGDTIYIPANTKHLFKKLSKEDSISIWIYHNISLDSTPPVFK